MPPRIPSPFAPDPNLFIPPRAPGESAYQYRYRRTLAMYGQTPYERRIWLAQQRGISTSVARGHARTGGESESQRRNRLSVENFGQTVSQIRRQAAREWLEEHGYTPELTGMTWTDLITLEPRLRYMYDAPEDARVTPNMIYQVVQLEYEGMMPKGWAFERLWEKYDDMIAYREYRDKRPGHEHYLDEYISLHPTLPEAQPTIQWWYYH